VKVVASAFGLSKQVEKRMAYTSTTLLLAVLLCVSAVAESTKLSRNSYDGICKTMVETKGYVCEEHQVYLPRILLGF
jgi:hypothetical protein